ncbi:RagB/SusD family nutrient uptake outer membrane protein [Aureibaculum algae]|uniref:RagB/SusD family nutrient uptake outer membrane protein n=1 Tax=Aureibaculum algae TaxID=2584122 RepID=A0A5B7TMC8_9FLAO|nr:RagB/SusD family nutrient uptake outer membrane protein [Aureibaculum algae]QCX37949.1 RagB/SusD family nutrient uptake outer membrane protein [Aureibaculum algae]
MKKFINIKIGILLLTISLISCNDNLNIEPEQYLSTEVVISNSENLSKVLNNAYNDARSSSSYGGSIAIASELIADDGDLWWNGTYVDPGEFIEKAMLSDNGFVESIWMNGYDIINQANIILGNSSVYADEDEKQTAEAEAKFLRAMVYFDLARLFSKPYTNGIQNTQLGVPLVFTAVLDPKNIDYPTRNTLEEVYTQVIADLTDAYDLLPSSNGVYATKYSAAALLARVYLQMGDYTNARDMANEVITNSGASLTNSFSGAFNNDENSEEDLLAWQVTSQDASSNYLNLFFAGSDFGGRSGNPDIDVEDQHYEIYDDSNDQRANFFYEAKYWCTTKWQYQFGNIPFIRLAEMYLIRAESNFRLTTTVGDTPVNDINILRNRSTASTFNSVDLDIILMERKRELSFEGFALFDAKRLGNNIGTISYDANQLVLPIPLRETDANTNLEQNPGY